MTTHLIPKPSAGGGGGSGTVTSVNGIMPDGSGNVNVPIPESFLSLDDTLDTPLANGYVLWNSGATELIYSTTIPWTAISGKPSFATVATSGDYNDLINKPLIPAAQIQSDWTQASTSAVDYIKNKPDLSSLTTAVQNAINIGGGSYQLFTSKSGTNLQFKTINAGSNIVINDSGTVLTINSTGGGGGGPANTDALPEGSTNLYFTQARVRNTPLTGITASTVAIDSSDTVLSAFGKAMGTFINAIPRPTNTDGVTLFSATAALAGWHKDLLGGPYTARQADHPDGVTPRGTLDAVDYYWVCNLTFTGGSVFQIAYPFLSTTGTGRERIKFRIKGGSAAYSAWQPLTAGTLTQSNFDVTPGRILKTGDGGWMGELPVIFGTNLDDKTLRGWRYWSTIFGHTGTPPAGVAAGMVITNGVTANFVFQEFTELIYDSTSARKWRRNCYDTGAWSEWEEQNVSLSKFNLQVKTLNGYFGGQANFYDIAIGFALGFVDSGTLPLGLAGSTWSYTPSNNSSYKDNIKQDLTLTGTGAMLSGSNTTAVITNGTSTTGVSNLQTYPRTFGLTASKFNEYRNLYFEGESNLNVLSTVLNTYSVSIGVNFFDTPVKHAWFSYSDSGSTPNWQFNYLNASSVITTVNTGIAVTTGSVNFKITFTWTGSAFNLTASMSGAVTWSSSTITSLAVNSSLTSPIIMTYHFNLTKSSGVTAIISNLRKLILIGSKQ